MSTTTLDNTEKAERETQYLGEGLGLFPDRKPQALRENMLPEGTVLVSADGHLATADIFKERFPEHLKHKAPRVWYDEEDDVYHLGFEGEDGLETFYPPEAFPIVRSIENHIGCRDFDARLRDQDVEGVTAEILFPQLIQIFFFHPDYEIREWIFRAYNQYLAEVQASHPDRMFPVGVVLWWDPDKAVESIREMKELGLKTYMLPMSAGKKPDGSNAVYSNPEYVKMWEAFEEAGLPICFHVGEKLDHEGPNGFGALSLWEFGGHFRKNFGELVFGGIFDRHPTLQIVFAEAGISWVPGMLQDAEMINGSIGHLFEFLPKHKPTYYWHKHCYATFMTDSAGLALIDRIGPDRVMWSTDYPHNEGTFGYTQDSIQQILDAVPEDDARKILGQTAIDVFNLGKDMSAKTA